MTVIDDTPRKIGLAHTATYRAAGVSRKTDCSGQSSFLIAVDHQISPPNCVTACQCLSSASDTKFKPCFHDTHNPLATTFPSSLSSSHPWSSFAPSTSSVRSRSELPWYEHTRIQLKKNLVAPFFRLRSHQEPILKPKGKRTRRKDLTLKALI